MLFIVFVFFHHSLFIRFLILLAAIAFDIYAVQIDSVPFEKEKDVVIVNCCFKYCVTLINIPFLSLSLSVYNFNGNDYYCIGRTISEYNCVNRNDMLI